MIKTYSISELAKEFDLTSRTIRHYEDKSLLEPERIGTQRRYSSGDRVRLQLILRGKRVGFSLDEIKEILDLYQTPSGKQKQKIFLLQKLIARKNQLIDQRTCINEMIDELEQIELRLQPDNLDIYP